MKKATPSITINILPTFLNNRNISNPGNHNEPISLICEILKNINACLKKWPKETTPKAKRKIDSSNQWEIRNEFHIHSLIWTILRPIFPGIKDEENLPSLGHRKPRADLAIPELKLLIETKFLRNSSHTSFSKVIEEISADANLYLTSESHYNHIIAFIWDNTCSTQHHDELIAGINKIHGIYDTIIIPRPGNWKKA